MIKGSIGGPIALLAAIAAAVSAFLPFWRDDKAYNLAIRGLWQGYVGLTSATFLTSIAMVLLIGSVILLASSFAGSQILSFLGCVWILGMLVLFVTNSRGSASIGDFLLDEVDYGFWVAAAAGVLALVAAFIPRTVTDTYRR
jgi:peptidoglycan biosynthesis protein MviN/MurJ (putative lipid II flippase)